MFENITDYSKRQHKKEKNKINVCLFYYDDPAFYIRLVSIFENFHDDKYNFFIVYPKDLKQFKKDLLNNNVFFDFIIIERNWLDFEISKIVFKKSKDLNYKVIFEIDDDLLNMDESNPGHSYFMQIKSNMESMIKNADIVTVSTESLKNSLSHLNKNIFIIPNRLIDSWFIPKLNKKNEDTIKIGYMGSIYHSWDLILIKNAIPNVIDYFSKMGITVIFELIGGTLEDLSFANQIEIPENCTRYFEFVDWFRDNFDWDIAIAPLEESNLNNAKSELKFLEYSALKVPAIYSAIGPYKNNVLHEKTGLLVFSNSQEEWTDMMIRLIENQNLREYIRNEAYKNVRKNYMLEKSIEQWNDIFGKYYSNQCSIKQKIKRLFGLI